MKMRVACMFLVSFMVITTAAREFPPQVLTKDTHDQEVQQGKWLVKYYAPWCKHCQQLTPVWNEVANNLHPRTNINVAKFDCTTDKSICSAQGVKGYPTLMFIDGDTKMVFKGDRGADRLVEFAERAARDPVTIVEGKLSEALASNDVSFVLRAPKEDLVVQRYEEVARTHRMHSYFFHVAEDSENGPEIEVFKDDKRKVFTGKLSNTSAIEDWVLDNMFPEFVQFSSDVAIKLRDVRPDRLIVVGVVAGEDSNTLFLQKLKEIAGSQPDSWNFQFAWMDGTGFWKGFIKHYWGVRGDDLPQLVAFNSVTRVYYSLDDASWNDMTTGEIEAFLLDVATGKVEGRGGTGFFATISTNLARLVDELQHAWRSSWVEYEVAMTIVGGTCLFILGLVIKRWLYPSKPVSQISVGKKD